MKKRKNIILSAITCFVSICMLMLGVYAASNPSVSINGQISYTARDAKVLVQGKVNGAKGQSTTVDYPSATVTPNTVTATKVTDKQTQYLDYTAGTGNSEQDVLSPCNIGTLEFAEDNTGVKDITISFKLTNLSTYPVQATLTFPTGATASDLANAKVSRTASATSTYLAQNGGNKEIIVTYKLTNDSQSIPADATNLLGMNIKFEKTALKIDWVSEINKNSGIVKMGTYTDSENLVKDVEWRCFAYSNDGTSWTKLESGKSIPVEAKYAYFVMDSAVWSGIEANNPGALHSKYSTTESTTGSQASYYKIEKGLEKVSKNDYYWSEARKVLKKIETTFNIDTSSDLYKAVKGRSMTDLYKKLGTGDGTSVNAVAPDAVGTDMNEKDAFWILSEKECTDLLDGMCGFGAGSIEDGSIIPTFWLRSGCVSARYTADTAIWRPHNYVWYEFGLMPAFMLELA